MGIPYQRGLLLYQQKRYAMAADEFRKELAQKPESASAMSMLALSLTYDGKNPEALQHARAAIVADPERAFCHYALACTIVGQAPRWTKLQVFLSGLGTIAKYRRRLRKAKPAAMEAVRLDPRNAENLGLISAIELDLKHPKEALQWADKGLAAKADHVRCANLRAKALSKLGRLADARQTLQGALAVNPEDASTHATSGWTLLKGGESQNAVKHFSESLRLNPMDENSKRGLSLAKAGKKAAVPGITAAIAVALLRLSFVSNAASYNNDKASVAMVVLALAFLILMVRSRRKNRKI